MLLVPYIVRPSTILVKRKVDKFMATFIVTPLLPKGRDEQPGLSFGEWFCKLWEGGTVLTRRRYFSPDNPQPEAEAYCGLNKQERNEALANIR
jgi:hypothetical protein